MNNKAIKLAGPSQPVRLIGFKSLPKAGDPIVCVQSEEIAKEIISRREGLGFINGEKGNNGVGSGTIRPDECSHFEPEVQITGVASKSGYMAQNILRRYDMASDEKKNDGADGDDDDLATEDNTTPLAVRIPVVIKADADGTLAAVRESLIAISEESSLDLVVDPILAGVGKVTASDVRLARDAGASIFCFNIGSSTSSVAADGSVSALCESENVAVRSHDVIYRLLEEAKDLFAGYFPPSNIERVHGEATVSAVFDINNKRNAERIAGLKVKKGTFFLDKSNDENGSLPSLYRVTRGGKVISPLNNLRAKSLRKVKEEVDNVRRGEECGLSLIDFIDLEEGDIIECFSSEMKKKFI